MSGSSSGYHKGYVRGIQWIPKEWCLKVSRTTKKEEGYGTKWVFHNKLDENGKVVRNMARLVAKGYSQ